MRTLLIPLALLLATGCTRPLVQLEQPYADSAPGSRRVIAPHCADIPLPPYPDVPVRDRPEKITVEMKFLIDETGRVKDLQAKVIGKESDLDPEPFRRASITAAATIHCRPAVRLPAPGAETLEPQPIPYRSSFLYHFLRDEEQAQAG